MNDPSPPSFSDLLNAVSDAADADIFLYAGGVTLQAERRFNDVLAAAARRKNVICLVTTYGGSADVAYQMVRAVRRHYPNGEFTLLVDSICKSAGTLIALGADCIAMDDTAELGPLDVQVPKPGELGELASGLTPSQALDTLELKAFQTFEWFFLNLRSKSQSQIPTRTAAELAVELAIGCYKPIYEQFDPMRLGENERSVAIARAYGQRILTENVRRDAIEQLINGYPSHGFVIDRDEAGELFQSVRPLSNDEKLLTTTLRTIAENGLDADQPIIRHLAGEAEADDDFQTASPGVSDDASQAAGEAASPYQPTKTSSASESEFDGGGENDSASSGS